MPITIGGKNPPSPPAAPTTPVTAPTWSGNHAGTSLNTAPVPRPRHIAIVRQAIVSGTIVLVGAGQHEREHERPDERDHQHVARTDAVRQPAAERTADDGQRAKPAAR